MKILKYVINESGTPILFEMSILHCEIITSAISAGLVIIDYNILTDEFVVKCYGGSESLKINSDKNDCLIIRNYLNNLFTRIGNNDVFSCIESDMVLSKKCNLRNVD